MTSTAFQKISACILAGKSLTVGQVESLIAADPVASAAFRAIAEEARNGVDVTIADVAKRTGFSEEFLVASTLAAIAGCSVTDVRVVHETVH